MKVYFRFLSAGELPLVNASDRYEILTVEDGRPKQARIYDSSRLIAHENWYVEHHPQWHKHPIDLMEEVQAWYCKPEVTGLREEIRTELMRDARAMQKQSVIVTVRAYTVIEGHGVQRVGLTGPLPHNPTIVGFAAGLFGMDFDPYLDFVTHGPSWEFETEKFVDQVIAGETIPEGLTRYGITPRGRIINPFPPTCEHCGHRHYGHHHGPMNFGAWANKVGS